MQWANFLLFGASQQSAPPDEQIRRITLSDRVVPYKIKRRNRRSLSMMIDHRGLRILGPMRVTLRDVEQLIYAHEAWILKKLDEWREERAPRYWSLHRKEPLPYLGASLPVVTRLHSLSKPKLHLEDTQLILSTHDPADAVRNHRALLLWLRTRALDCFEKRIEHYSNQLGVPIPPLSLTQAKTRWGSCSSRGHIRLNWRLIHLPLPLIDYVVAHELAHLKEMNHSPRFWAIVETMVPDCKTARRDLRQQSALLPLIHAGS